MHQEVPIDPPRLPKAAAMDLVRAKYRPSHSWQPALGDGGDRIILIYEKLPMHSKWKDRETIDTVGGWPVEVLVTGRMILGTGADEQGYR